MALRSIGEYLILVIVLFTIASLSPFIACVVFFFLLLRTNQFENRSWIAVIVLSSILIGAVNAVKVPENDLEGYIELYHLSKDMPLTQYIWVGSTAGGVESVKEPFYPVVVWVLNRLCFDNEPLFKFAFSFINYFLLNMSVLIVGKRNKFDPIYILLGMIMMTFIPYIFTLSLHAMRQFIAGAFLMVIVSLRCYSDVKPWKLIVLSLLMILLHTSSILFIPFIFIKAFDRKWTEAKIWYVGLLACLALLRILSVLLSGYLGEVGGLLGYALSRASQETGYEVDAIGMIGIVLVIVIISVSYYFTSMSSIMDEKGIRRFYNIPLFVGIFVLLNLNMKELSLRYLFYLYFFVPFIAMFLARLYRLSRSTIILVSTPVILFFLVYLQYGVWTYDIPFTVFFTPLIAYLYN